MFHIGQLVVCVDAEKRSRWDPPSGLKRGSVYTIAGVVEWLGSVGVLTEEVEMPSRHYLAHHASRFRPLKDSALDVFRQALEPAPKQAEPA